MSMYPLSERIKFFVESLLSYLIGWTSTIERYFIFYRFHLKIIKVRTCLFLQLSREVQYSLHVEINKRKVFFSIETCEVFYSTFCVLDSKLKCWCIVVSHKGEIRNKSVVKVGMVGSSPVIRFISNVHSIYLFFIIANRLYIYIECIEYDKRLNTICIQYIL